MTIATKAPISPQNPLFDTTNWLGMKEAKGFFDNVDKFGDALGTIGKFIGHPILIFNAVSGASYWICLVIGLTGIILYVCGVKKALKYSGGSLLGFSLIKLIEAGLNAI